MCSCTGKVWSGARNEVNCEPETWRHNFFLECFVSFVLICFRIVLRDFVIFFLCCPVIRNSRLETITVQANQHVPARRSFAAVSFHFH
jgi:hypothetical protein